jgi:hypothetical protein
MSRQSQNATDQTKQIKKAVSKINLHNVRTQMQQKNGTETEAQSPGGSNGSSSNNAGAKCSKTFSAEEQAMFSTWLGDGGWQAQGESMETSAATDIKASSAPAPALALAPVSAPAITTTSAALAF